MKKSMPVLVILAVLAFGAVVYYRPNTDNKKSTANDGRQAVSESKYRFKKACNILTEADARRLLGNDITGGTTSANAATNDIDVSTCSYNQQFPAGTPATELREAMVAIVRVRAAKSDAGALNNINQFERVRPTGSQDVGGYGDKAYWNQASGQLNILKRNNWYFLTYGKIPPGDRTLEQAKKLADLIAPKL